MLLNSPLHQKPENILRVRHNDFGCTLPTFDVVFPSALRQLMHSFCYHLANLITFTSAARLPVPSIRLDRLLA